MRHQLSIHIDPTALDPIRQAGQAITLVAACAAEPFSAENPPVAWLQLPPRELTTVAWDAECHGYATGAQPAPGAVIAPTAVTPAPMVPGCLYALRNARFLSTTRAGDTFNVANEQGTAVWFGLARAAVASGARVLSPLNVVSVPAGELASFLPRRDLHIFLAPDLGHGAVLTHLPSDTLVVTLTPADPTVHVAFFDPTRTFYRTAAPPDSRRAGAPSSHRRPS
ncbi:MAG: hypothetical protein R3F14_13715 [Polyangiaceae bacterium]